MDIGINDSKNRELIFMIIINYYRYLQYSKVTALFINVITIFILSLFKSLTLINEHFIYIITRFDFNRRRYHYLPFDLVTYFFIFSCRQSIGSVTLICPKLNDRS
jgi:hypothetical protein